MNLLLGAVNTGDMMAQLIMFLILIGIPLIIVLLFVTLKKKDNRLKRLENKVDQLLEEKHN